jgi:osmoprotectant transport system permease protein
MLAFIWTNGPSILHMLVEHLQIVAVGVGFAILTGVPLGIAIGLSERVARVVLYVAAILMTVPSVALFGLLIPVLSLIGQGIGFLPAVIALFLYSQLPIVRNTYTAIRNLDPAMREAARGRARPRSNGSFASNCPLPCLSSWPASGWQYAPDFERSTASAFAGLVSDRVRP